MSKVLVNFIQDRSGSMQSVWEETLSGFRAFVTKLRDDAKVDGVEYLFSLTTFDTLVETPIVSEPIDNVDVDELKKHGPRGSTALYDAVGATIQNTDANRKGAEKIIVVVVTDGHENSSREWDKDKLHTAVDAKLRAGDWTFTYLGTQPETWDDAGTFGVAGSARRYAPGRSAEVYATMALGVSRFASSKLHMSSPDLVGEYLSSEETEKAGISSRDAQEPSKPVTPPGPPKEVKPTSGPKQDGRPWR